jgi:hypothetical protein
MLLGRQRASSPTTATTLIRAARRSASSGPSWFETTNCVPAKATPLTAITGHTSSIRLNPAITVTSIPGMMRASSGVWRPTICESSRVSRPAREAPVRIGMPKPPKATGAVFASRARAAA